MAPRDDGIGASVRRKEDLRFLTGRGMYTDDINRPGQLHAYILRSPHPHAGSRHDRHVEGREGQGRRRRVHRRRHGQGQCRRPALRLGDQVQGRQPDEGAAASAARDRTRALCRRPGRRGHRRQPRGREGRGRADRGRLQAAGRGGQHRRGGQAGGAAALGHSARQYLLRLGAGRQGCHRRGVQEGAQGREDRAGQQPPDPQRDGAARRDRRFRSAPPATSRSTPPARTRT